MSGLALEKWTKDDFEEILDNDDTHFEILRIILEFYMVVHVGEVRMNKNKIKTWIVKANCSGKSYSKQISHF